MFLMHLPILILVNIANAYVFWLMWGGFYLACKYGTFYNVLAWQSISIAVGFFAYAIRNKPLAQKTINFDRLPEGVNRAKAAYNGCIVAAYALSSLSLIAAPLIYFITGGVDVWLLGQNT